MTHKKILRRWALLFSWAPGALLLSTALSLPLLEAVMMAYRHLDMRLETLAEPDSTWENQCRIKASSFSKYLLMQIVTMWEGKINSNPEQWKESHVTGEDQGYTLIPSCWLERPLEKTIVKVSMILQVQWPGGFALANPNWQGMSTDREWDIPGLQHGILWLFRKSVGLASPTQCPNQAS